MVKLFLTGPGGSGKTTLAQALKRQNAFNDFEHISEVARELMKGRNMTGEDLKRFDTDQFICFQEDILKEQCIAEANKDGYANLISDRSILDCLAHILWKTGGELENAKIEEIISRNKVCVIVGLG